MFRAMPESAEEVYARIVARVGEDGHLPTPPVHEWDTFPWEGVAGPRTVLPPLPVEAPRSGVDGVGCWRCENPDESVIWRNERWLVSTLGRPSGLPLVVFLMSREHLDFTDMDDSLASEYGRLSVRLARIVSRMPNIGRVHVNKWGDGSEHLHTWFIARTERMPQTIGSYAVEWDEILPAVPEDVWRADLKYVADRMATHDGAARI
jgi:diadenosine tetraphosphate (Ap4A) HIT family hydrolase